jgi:hypothetical protein
MPETQPRLARRSCSTAVCGYPLPVCLLAGLAVAFLPHKAVAQSPAAGLASYRIAVAPNKYHETCLVGFALRPQSGARWRPEAAVAIIRAPDKTRPLVSIGPVWRLTPPGRELFVELGVAPTLIGGTRLDGKDLGGIFHFTSSAAVGTGLARHAAWSAVLRFQHMSNASLRRPNPGLNLLGLDFSYRFTGR